MTNFLKIKNTRLFAESIRKNVAMIFPRSYYSNIDSLISVDQTEILVQKYLEPAYEDGFIINEKNYAYLFTEIKKWIYNRSLSKVASSGKIECAWDEKNNEMVFWDPKSKHIFNIIK